MAVDPAGFGECLPGSPAFLTRTGISDLRSFAEQYTQRMARQSLVEHGSAANGLLLSSRKASAEPLNQLGSLLELRTGRARSRCSAAYGRVVAP